MINSIIESSNKLSINQFDTEIEILKAVGDELIKEYFLELEGVYIEESAFIPNIETEKVPAIQKIGDWFKRIINRIVAYITSKRVRKMIEKITESKRFEDREDDEMMEGLFPDLNWLMEDVTMPWGKLKRTIDALFDNTGKFKQSIFSNTGAQNLQKYAKDTRNTVEDIEDTYDDVKNLLTAEPGRIVHKSMKVSDIKKLIKEIEVIDHDLSDKIKMLNSSVSEVKKMATDLSERNMNNKSGANSVAVVFVQCITNLSKGLLLIAQIHVRVLNRLYMTMGDDHLSKKEED